MTNQTESSNTSNEDPHCLICNVSIKENEDVLHNIFNEIRLPNYSREHTILAEVGRTLGRSLVSINMHSDLICHNCFLLLVEHATMESKFFSLRAHLVKIFDETAAKHVSLADNDNQNNLYDMKSKNPEKDIVRIISEEGKLIIIDKVKVTKFSPGISESNFMLHKKNKMVPKKKKYSPSKGSAVYRPFICHVCGKDFRAYSHCVEHMLIHLGEKPWSCSQCNKSFRTKSTLKLHSIIHTGQRPFHCEKCSKSFSEKCYLKEHNRIHSGEKPFKCNFCDRSFTRKKNLVVHLKVHTGDKQFLCSQCPKMFAVKSRLERHFMIHSGKKPYECQLCTRSFARKDDYEVHIRQHTGERPFQCSHCEKSFASHSSRLRHIRTHAEAKTYSCSVCSKNFTHRRKLEEHFQETHISEATKEPGELVKDHATSPEIEAKLHEPPVRETVIRYIKSNRQSVLDSVSEISSVSDLYTLQPVPVDSTLQFSSEESHHTVNTSYLSSGNVSDMHLN